jgi:hypothetical protein
MSWTGTCTHNFKSKLIFNKKDTKYNKTCCKRTKLQRYALLCILPLFHNDFVFLCLLNEELNFWVHVSIHLIYTHATSQIVLELQSFFIELECST